MLKVLSWYLDIVEFGKTELAQRVAVRFEVLARRSSIQLFFEFIPPLPQLMNVLVHGGLLGDEVFFKRTSYMRWKNGLGKLPDIGFGGRRQLEILRIGIGISRNVLG